MTDEITVHYTEDGQNWTHCARCCGLELTECLDKWWLCRACNAELDRMFPTVPPPPTEEPK